MITKQIGKNYFCYDSYSYKNNKQLRDFIQDDLSDVFEKISENFILILGGDGTLLRAIKEHYEKNIPFLGLNFGTKGILLNSKESIKSLDNYNIKNYPLLEVSYEIGKKKYKGVCFNEINITVGDGKVLDLEVQIARETYILRGDGVLISTPAGSTGYNRSLFGPILDHSEQNFIMTPKADINLQRSVIFSNSERGIVKNIHRLNPIEIYLDSNRLGENIVNTQVEIEIKKSDRTVNMIVL